jgi:hypothetical protein
MRYCYHITKAENKESIMKQGIIPQIGKNTIRVNDPKGVYLFKTIEALEDALGSWMDEDFFGEDEETVILKVTLPDDFPLIQGVYDDELIAIDVIPPEYITCIEE